MAKQIGNLPTMATRLLITIAASCLAFSTQANTPSLATPNDSQSITTALPVSGMLVTTHPLYLIASAVTKGIEQPLLLLAPNQTGHDVQLKPADLKRIKNANFVLWFGTAYEQGLAHILKNQANSVALFDLKAFQRLPLRNSQAQALTGTLDAHLWLNPVNASAIAHAIAAIRSQQFPQYATRYQANANQFSQQLLTVAQQYRNLPVKPYWAYHDAYQYLESSLNLQFKGSLTLDHELPPTLNQLQWLQQQRMTINKTAVNKTSVKNQNMCLLSESTIAAATLQRLQPVQVQIIDETMQSQHDFVKAWLHIAQQVINC